MSGALSWRHQAIIQALLSRGPLKEKDLHSMFEQLTKKNPGFPFSLRMSISVIFLLNRSFVLSVLSPHFLVL